MVQKINDKEILIRKVKLEIEKAKNSKEFFETKVPQMEQQVVELNLVVERMTREADKETKRRLEATKERDTVQSKYGKLLQVFESL